MKKNKNKKAEKMLKKVKKIWQKFSEYDRLLTVTRQAKKMLSGVGEPEGADFLNAIHDALASKIATYASLRFGMDGNDVISYAGDDLYEIEMLLYDGEIDRAAYVASGIAAA